MLFGPGALASCARLWPAGMLGFRPRRAGRRQEPHSAHIGQHSNRESTERNQTPRSRLLRAVHWSP